MPNLPDLIGYTLCGMLIFLELAVLVAIFLGFQKDSKYNGINLSKLISEKNGDASMSRFQFLVFTFVIALSLFLIVTNLKDHFPEVPQGVLALLGISGSSYLVSKGIQLSNGGTQPALVISPATAVQARPGDPIPTLTASLVNAPAGTPIPSLTWSLEAPANGTITAVPPNQAQYTPPPPASPPTTTPGTKVTIHVKAAGFEDGTSTVTLA